VVLLLNVEIVLRIVLFVVGLSSSSVHCVNKDLVWFVVSQEGVWIVLQNTF
jgi:hypothetical protein